MECAILIVMDVSLTDKSLRVLRSVKSLGVLRIEDTGGLLALIAGHFALPNGDLACPVIHLP